MAPYLGSLVGAAANQRSSISSATGIEVARSERHSTLASFHSRAPAEDATIRVAPRDALADRAPDRRPGVVRSGRQRSEANGFVPVRFKPTADRRGKFARHVAAQCHTHGRGFRPRVAAD